MIKKLLIANRSEIAIRIARAATELDIKTVAIYAYQDRFALHRFKADESYEVGHGKEPIKAYLDIDDLIRVALEAKADAIHPGYGFLSESPEFAQACTDNGIIFVGPTADILTSLGDKVQARRLAKSAGVPMVPATEALPQDPETITKLASEIGFPIMVKASWGGGGRGMRMVFDPDKLLGEVTAASREAEAAFGKGEVFLEKLVQNARHVEVQIFGDRSGQVFHLHERDCSVQRRHQKVVEMAPAAWMDSDKRNEITAAAVNLGKTAGYLNAGTVEFLYDVDDDAFYFIEVNPRVQVEHTVTEMITGVDIVKAQIRIAEGAKLGTEASGVPAQSEIPMNGHAVQCRITTEDPENGFVPDYGQIVAYRGATGFGIRLDGGTAFSGAIITPFFDSLLEKLTTWAPTRTEAVKRMDRALREFRIRGVKTNLQFLEKVINHKAFVDDKLTTRFVDDTPELFHFPKRRDRASRLLSYIGDVMVNGNPEMEGRPRPDNRPDLARLPEPQDQSPGVSGDKGSRTLLRELGSDAFSTWLGQEKKLLLTDTTFRDAHQSLMATRTRTIDLRAPLPAYEKGLKNLFSLETWGGATFDSAMRFLKEDPWDRLTSMREQAPSIIMQMLLRGANAVGYANYPDNVVDRFVDLSHQAGVDLFRVFDSLNWVENMIPAMEAVRKHDTALCEAAICYTGDLTREDPGKYNLAYYIAMAKELQRAGAHILCIKDMAGLCKPAAASELITALKAETGLPIHFHTHDTSGGSLATLIAASQAGVDVVDVAMDPMSGHTSQPNLGTLVEMLRNDERDTGLNRQALNQVSRFWEQIRDHYSAFESSMRASTSDVYIHEMPGGQYTNLRQQARAMGLEQRWPEAVQTYAAVNQLFGDVVKVTPSSKVVGDMALYMLSHNLTAQDLEDDNKEVSFPESVISFFRGDLGQPYGGFPKALQAKILRGEEPLSSRPGASLPPVDFDEVKKDVEKKIGRSINDYELLSYLMYPQVFTDFAKHKSEYSDVSVVPTPVFLWGPEPGEEFYVDLSAGKRLIIRFLATGEADAKGNRQIFFELNGQPRTVVVNDRSKVSAEHVRPKSSGAEGEVAAPMPGSIVTVEISVGETVSKGQVLLTIEAMKMETSLFAEKDGKVEEVHVQTGDRVDVKDLLVRLSA
ncbi:pyruvate carboxylase [Alphaproteobacteria bacterium]|nr:pyruvate carboxylase [Alphaproteobacteria bacterium]